MTTSVIPDVDDGRVFMVMTRGPRAVANYIVSVMMGAVLRRLLIRAWHKHSFNAWCSR